MAPRGKEAGMTRPRWRTAREAPAAALPLPSSPAGTGACRRRSRAACGLDRSQEKEEKKTRYLPSRLRSCHGCGRRFPYKGRGERLRPLDSQWRVVLLCGACLGGVRSAQVCSYCFSGLAGRGEDSVGCRRCSCRVHERCVPEQRGFCVPSDLHPGSFTCVDCCAFPDFGVRKLGSSRDSSEFEVPDLSAGNAVVDTAKSAGVENVVDGNIPATSS